MKACSLCAATKSVSEFYRDSSMKSGYSSQCKACRNAAPREDRIDAILWTKYRIRRVDYDAMYEAQSGKCAICEESPSGESRYDKLCVDHNHITGEVRGLLCGSCNLGLGKFKDDVILLINAAKYLTST